jgi:hypothetical protein
VFACGEVGVIYRVDLVSVVVSAKKRSGKSGTVADRGIAPSLAPSREKPHFSSRLLIDLATPPILSRQQITRTCEYAAPEQTV